MTASSLLQIFLGLGSFAGLAALLSVVWQRRKFSAEATKMGSEARDIAQATVDRIIQNLERENERLRNKENENDEDMVRIIAQLRELRERISIYDAEISELRVLVVGTIHWSKQAITAIDVAREELKEHNIDVDLNLTEPPDASRLLAKFKYIEDRVRGKESDSA